MQSHQTGGQPMSSSQLQELQRRLHLQMRQQHQAAAGQQNTHQQLVGTMAQDLHSSESFGSISHGIHGSGSPGTMSQGLHQMQQMQHAQFGNQLWSDPAGSQQGQEMNSFRGTNNAALSLMQQQGPGLSQMARTGGASSAQVALYMNALQASSATGAGAKRSNRPSMSEMGGMTGTARMGYAASVQQQSGSMGLGNGQQMQQLRDQMNQSDAISQQRQNMGSSSSMLTFSDTQPQMAAGNTSAQLLMHQQKMIADLKRQLQGQHGGSNAGINTNSAGSMMPPSHDRHLSGSSLSGQQRQALFQTQQQRSKSMSNVLGDVQDQSLGTNDRSSSLGSVGSVKPISMPSIFASQNQLTRRGSDSSQTNVMGHVFGGATGGSASGVSLLMQQIANGDNEQLVAPQQLLNSSGMQPIWQDMPLVAQSSSRLNSLLLGQPGDSHVQQIVAEVGYQSTASDTGGKNEPDSVSASGGNENRRHGGRCSKSKNGSTSAEMLGSDTSADGQQSYLDGTFEGGWQSNADLPMRRGIIFSIVKLIEQMRPDADKMSEKLPQMAKRLEEHLYRSARTREQYLDSATLKRRLQSVAQGLEVHRSLSTVEQTGGADQTPSLQMLLGQGNGSDSGISKVERRTQTLQQQLQQMLQLQEQGTSNDYLSREAKFIIMQHAGLSGAMPGSLQSSTATPSQGTSASQAPSVASAPAPSGILKIGRYQDPGAAQKRKVVQQQQQRLLLLRHASKCTAGAGCRTKFCGQMVALWKHMKRCRNKNCKTAHCLSSRCVLNHYRMCKNENKTSTCEVCAPVMRQIKWQQSAQVEEDPMFQDDSNIPSSAAVSLAKGLRTAQVPACPDTAGQQKRQPLEELQATQQKLEQQQLLLKQFREHEAHLTEQQEQLRQQQQHVQPHTQEDQQLQQQQGLLLQLQQLFQQQQLLLQHELVRQSQAIQGEQTAALLAPNSVPLPLDSIDMTTKGGKRMSPSCEPEQKLSPSGRDKASRGRGKKGKRLSAKEMAEVGDDGSHSTASIGGLKRSADQAATELEPGDAYERRFAKVAKVETTDSMQMAEPQGVSVTEDMKDTEKRMNVLEQGNAGHATSLIQSMTNAAVECHLESLNKSLHLTPQAISRRCLPLIQKLIDDPFGWVFCDPVDPVVLGLPDYFDVVKNPMHLTLIETKLRNNDYSCMESFAQDTKLVFDNAILYNGEGSDVGQLAAVMLRHFETDYKAVLKAIDNDRRDFKGSDDMCTLCGSQRRLFEPVSLCCSGACGMQKIRRNATYYTDRTKQNHWCASCYLDLDENDPVVLEDGSEVRKAALQKLKNDGLPEEAWVQCDECNGWVHQICALFNGRRNKSSTAYLCPKCHIDKAPQGETVEAEKPVKVAKDLPHCKMSAEIEKGLNRMLTNAYEDRAKELGIDVSEVEKAEGLSVRVISNMEKNHLVRDEMVKRYAKKGSPSAFPVRSKCIALFQTIYGVDVILFAMYVYEYDDSCPPPNRRRVYVSYLDSVCYFEPKCYRTIAYHGIIIEYLRYVKERGFHTAHIWSCPPSAGDDYVFYCHPKDQLVPSESMLRQWYHCMLDKAKAEGIVLETRTLYDEYFKNNGMDATSGLAVDPTCLPYFEGDYIPGEIEKIIKDVKGEEEAKRQERFPDAVGLESCKKAGNKMGTRSNPGDLVHLSQDKVMLRLGQAIYNMRENFMVVRLRSKAFASAVDGGEDVTGWVDVEGDENSLSNKKFKISGKACSSSLFHLPVHQQKDSLKNKSESGCTTEDATDLDSSICATEKEATVAADDTDRSDASAAAPSTKRSIHPLVKGADSSHPVEAGLSSREEAALPKGNKEALLESSATQTISNGQTEPLAQDGVGEATQAKVDEQKDSTKSEQPEQSKEPASASKRGFDEIEPTLSRHFASIIRNAKPVGSTADEDEPQETEMFESRQQILNYCQTHHFQFDELRRAKHSTMMILFQLHNPSAPMFLQQCGACYCDITHGARYHCNDCSNFDLCHDCYEPVTTGLSDKRDSRFTHDKRHTFVAIDMEGPADTQKSRDECARTIKMHLKLLSHAAICNGPPSCSLNNCLRMKKLFEHVESCEVTYENGCKICSRLLALLTMHARMCTVGCSCPLPFCDRIRERNRRRKQQQQLMDDRRRQAQNELYRSESTA